jgi:beta-1,4-mannosyl-glycoprotein beta-1,4-N-acetylglucosaminyltransferase
MKVFDCFTFFNELDLLEFRLKLLSNVVDKFVICESNYTHSGKIKPYYFNENKERFKEWEEKIIYLPVEQSIENLEFNKVKTYSPSDGSWVLENEQRLALTYASEIIAEDDIVMVGDLDEIPDPRAVSFFYEGNFEFKNPISLSMLFHYYYMNCQMEGYDRNWNGTVVCTGKMFREIGSQHLRNDRNLFQRIPNAGWHFSYLGGLEKIKKKIESFAHTEFNVPEVTSDENILNAINKGQDIFNRSGISYNYVPINYYPDFLQEVMIQYPQFIKDVS